MKRALKAVRRALGTLVLAALACRWAVLAGPAEQGSAQGQVQAQARVEVQRPAKAPVQAANPGPAATAGRLSGPGAAPALVLLLVVDRLDWEEVASPATFQHLQALAREGAVALMNTRVAGGWGPSPGYLTIGSGSRAEAEPGDAAALMPGETAEPLASAGDLFRRWTGEEPPAGEALVPHVARIRRENEALPYPLVPGALGERLREAGVIRWAIGGQDTRVERARPAALITMDTRGAAGKAAWGQQIELPDPVAPGGLRTDWSAVRRLLRELAEETGWAGAGSDGRRPLFVVVDAGDLARLEGELPLLSDRSGASHRQLALERLDAFVGWLRRTPPWSDRAHLLLVVPNPSSAAAAGDRLLTPLIWKGPGVEAGAGLTSGTTRRAGLVANIDVAPTILDLFGIQAPAGMLGRAMETGRLPAAAPGTAGSGAGTADRALLLEGRRLAAIYSLRPPVLKALLTAQLVLFLAALTAALWRRRVPSRLIRVLELAVEGLAAVPLALLSPWVGQQQAAAAAVALAVALAAVAVAAARWIGERLELPATAVLGGLTAGAVLVDGLRGSPLIQASLMGYDATAGARYYGIGNEHMGLLVGGTIVAAGAVLDRIARLRAGELQATRLRVDRLGATGPLRAAPPEGGRRLGRVAGMAATALLFAGVAAILGLPTLGANVGGAITAAFSFTVTWMLLWAGRPNPRVAIAGTAAALAAVLLVGWLDASRPAEVRSHLGQALWLAKQEGAAPVFSEIAARKLAMNLRLVRYSIWTRGLVVGIAAMALLLFRPGPAVRPLLEGRPALRWALVGATASAATAFLVNDSGVVAAATALLFAASTVLTLALHG